jgi:DNA-binding XRE family transcriptional regulator
MLAVVKDPHIEIALHGTGADQIVQLLRENYAVDVFNVDNPEDQTSGATGNWWEKTNKHRAMAVYRHQKDITQKELADLTGFPQSVISEYERGRRPLTLKAAMKLGKALNVTPEQLLS